MRGCLYLLTILEVFFIEIKSSLYFEYAGQRSIDFGIFNVNVTSGMSEEPFVAPREIKEVSISGNDRPYFQKIKRKPLQFNVSFAFQEKWNEAKMREVTRWLTGYEYYQPLTFSEDNERIYYALVIDSPKLVHNCLREGYIDLTFRCDSPYSYSPFLEDKNYNWNETPSVFTDQDFDRGESHNLIVDEDGKLIIDPTKTKWSDLPSTYTWEDLL